MPVDWPARAFPESTLEAVRREAVVEWVEAVRSVLPPPGPARNKVVLLQEERLPVGRADAD